MRSWIIMLGFVGCLVGCGEATPAEHLERALGYLESGETSAAIIELKNTLQKAPDNAEARYRLGVVYARMGNLPAAQKELERALDLGYDPARVRIDLWRVKIQSGQYQEVLGAIAETQDRTPAVLALEGLARLQAGETDRADELLREALAEDPTVVDAHLGLAYLRIAQGDGAAAGEHLSQAVELDPKHRLAWLTKGERELAAKQLDDALASFQKAAQLPGGEIPGAVGVARAHLLSGRLDETLSAIEPVLARVPSLPIANYIVAVVNFQRGELEAAEGALREVQAQAPSHLPTMLLMGAVKAQLGDDNQAISELNRFLSQRPDDVSARKLLASVYLKRNTPAEAIDVLTPVADQLDPQGLAMLGVAHQRHGDQADATRYLQAAVEQAPDLAALRTQLALSLLAGGDEAAAEVELTTAISLDESFLESDMLLVLTRLRAGDYEAALTAAEALVAKDEQSPVGHNMLGAAYLAMEQRDEAIAAFEQALALDPTFTPAVANLARLAVAAGDPEAAVERYRTLLDADPGNEPAALAVARATLARGDAKGAVETLEAARTANPDAYALRVVLGRMLLEAGQGEAADAVTAEALLLRPTGLDARVLKARVDASLGQAAAARDELLELRGEGATLSRTALLLLAQLSTRAGDVDAAVRIIEERLAAQPEDRGAQMMLANIEMQRGELDRARGLYEALFEELPDNPMLLNNLAWLYAEIGDERAEALARKAHSLVPDNPQITDTLGWILLGAGEPAEATVLLKQAHDASGTQPSIAYHYAVALEQTGDLAAAADVARVALETPAFPERAEAEALLERLGGGH